MSSPEAVAPSTEHEPITSEEARELAEPALHETVSLAAAAAGSEDARWIAQYEAVKDRGWLRQHESNDRDAWTARYRQSMASEIAGKLHEDWRQTRRREDGTYVPRVKTTTDQGWIEAHGTDQVDIANTSYRELPKDWQAENKAAAEVVYDLVDDPETRPMVVSAPEDPAPAGERVHDAWLGRNKWAAGGELDKPFKELPADEQAKDTRQVEIGRQAFGYEEPERKAA